MNEEMIQSTLSKFKKLYKIKQAKNIFCKSIDCDGLNCNIQHCKEEEGKIESLISSIVKDFKQCDQEFSDKLFATVKSHIEAITSKEKKGVAYQSLGSIYHQLEDYLSSLEYFKKSDIDLTRSAILYYNIGTLHGLLNQHNDAVVYYHKAIKENTNFDLPYFNLGFSYRLLGNHEDSLKYYLMLEDIQLRAKPERKDDSYFWIVWGENRLYNLNDVDGAIEVLEEGELCTQINNKHKLYYQLSVAYFMKSRDFFEIEDEYFNNLQSAREYKEKAIALLEKAGYDNLIVDLYYLDNEFEKAFEYSEKSIADYPSQVDNNNAHGQILLKLDRVKDAIRYFKKALYFSKGEYDIRINLAEAFRRNNQFNEARFELMTSLKIDRHNTDALKSLINLDIDLGDDNSPNGRDGYNAIEYFEEALDSSLRLIDNKYSHYKKLARPELSHQFYLLAYINFRLYHLYNRKKSPYIKDAFKYLKNIEYGSKHFYKSKAIGERIKDFQLKRHKHNNKRRHLTIIGLVIIVFGLFLLIFGKPNLVGIYVIDQKIVKELIDEGIINPTDSTIISDFSNKYFPSERNAYIYLQSKGLIDNNANPVSFRAIRYVPQWSHFEKFDDLLLLSIFLSGVILSVLGIIYEDVKLLKLPGGIELERVEFERVDLENELTPTAFKNVRD